MDPSVSRRRALWKNYRLTPEQYDALVEGQGGQCAICGTSDPGSGGADAAWHIDHDHITGTVRGLLCSVCNTGLGHFKDDPELLRRAADYVEKWAQQTLQVVGS